MGGAVTVTDTTVSTSATTGSITTTGGLGVTLDVFVGGAVSALATTASTSTSTGALISAGGLGVAGDTFIGGTLTVTALNVGAISSPASGDTCTNGAIKYDGTYVYVCVGTDSWGRAALTTGY